MASLELSWDSLCLCSLVTLYLLFFPSSTTRTLVSPKQPGGDPTLATRHAQWKYTIGPGQSPGGQQPEQGAVHHHAGCRISPGEENQAEGEGAKYLLST